LALELYADKSKLSSFGTEKGYPIMARILNLPVKMRNGEGVGGARVVGWLPIVRTLETISLPHPINELTSISQVDDSPEDKARTAWVNFKRVIWHESFNKFLETIEDPSKEGRWVRIGNDEEQVFPVILILSADFEEQ
jgi:hypothetical protein